jgi:hypothetical protein
MPVEITDGQVTCPNCDSEFEVKQHKSVGASYAHRWWKISIFHQHFLFWWLGSGYKDGKYEKSTLRDAFNRDTGTSVSDDAFNARMSELVGAGTAFAPALVHKTKGVKSDPHYTTGAPKYSINIPRAERVLLMEGILEN